MKIISTKDTSNGTVFNAKGDVTGVIFQQDGTVFTSGFGSGGLTAAAQFGGTPGTLEFRWIKNGGGGSLPANAGTFLSGNNSISYSLSVGVGGANVTVECRDADYPLDVFSDSGIFSWEP